MRANLPNPAQFLNLPVPERPDITIREFVASGNDGHLFRGHSEALGRDVACKIIPRANLLHDADGRETWRNEVHKADALRNPAVVKFEDIREWRGSSAEPTQNVDCVVLISEFVEGPSLRKFISENPEDITVSFVRQWIATMLNLLVEMKARNVVHGDLHAGNVLVEDRSSYDLMGPPVVFRVTDFGVGDSTSEPRFKDDFKQVAQVLANLLRAIDFQACSLKDKFIFGVLRDHFLGRHLIEDDPTRDPIARQPRELFQRLQALDTEYDAVAAIDSTKLLTPFDFLSCEQIGEDPSMLRALYSDRFLGLPEIESRNNLVLTGPRGCGKSTVFRSLSLDQRMRTGEAAPEHLPYLGVYYRCDDLYFAFPRYVLPGREDAFDIPIHFVTATLLSRFLDSLEGWAREHFESEFVPLEMIASEGVWRALGTPPPGTPDAMTFRGIVARLNKERLRAAEWHRFVDDPKRKPGCCFGPEVLQRVCSALTAVFPFVRERPVYFFVDDYSSPKITRELQANLNRLFMQRTSVCFFKLSTESPVSFAKHDLDQKIYVENREFILHNLGLIYLHADVATKLTFVEDVFRRRLNQTASPYPARQLGELVGSSANHNNNEMARRIRAGEKPSLWGKEVLCKLCSGDIHYLISLVGDMVKLAGGAAVMSASTESCKIPLVTQNRAIREAAGGFLKNLRGIPKCGDQLVAIVEAFGQVALSHLKLLDSKNDEGKPPKQASRIEPYEPFTLGQTAQDLYDELLRYSVFIEDFRGKSRRGNVVPRLYLRRFLIPHFNLTFSTRDSIELEPDQFAMFLLNPRRFEEAARLRSEEAARRYEAAAEAATMQPGLGFEEPSQ
jgi:serine/threonine protein kinase